MNYTKGKWRKATDAQGTCGIMHPTINGVAIAWFSDAHLPLCYVGDGIGRPEREANVNLFFAAPDLLEALEEIMEGYVYMSKISGYEDIVQQRMQKARAAIKKAKGAT